MKNLKNMFAGITLAVILTIGTTGANAAIFFGAPQCSDTKSDLVKDFAAIFFGMPQFAGILISDKPQCVDTNGILISD